MSNAYALKQPHPDGSEWIQEHDSLDDALRYQSANGGILVRREQIPGSPGLWWVEVGIVDRIAKLLYDGICETCDGYVEDFSKYPNDNGIPDGEFVDGRIEFRDLAIYVIDKLGLTCKGITNDRHPRARRA